MSKIVSGVLGVGLLVGLHDHGEYYCAPSCDADDDCPAGWACAEVGVTMNGVATDHSGRSCIKARS